MKDHNKILLIGLPRCGSQYSSQLICRNFQYVNLHEPYTIYHQYSIEHVGKWFNVVPAPNFVDFNSRITHAHSVLQKLKENDRILIKYFPHTQLDAETNKETVTKLINLGFTPVILKRKNIEHHVISHLVANQTNIWYSRDVNFKRSKIEVTDFSIFQWLDKIHEEYYKLAQTFGKNSPVIEYESAEEDIKRIFHADKIYPCLSVKLSSKDPYDDIINVDQVRDIVGEHVSEIQQIRNKYGN